MISAETMAELEARWLLYILGVRERSDKLVRELVLDDPAPFVPLAMKKRGKETDYEAKTVMLAGRRYIVCRNHQEAEKDAADRASILAALERQLAAGGSQREPLGQQRARMPPGPHPARAHVPSDSCGRTSRRCFTIFHMSRLERCCVFLTRSRHGTHQKRLRDAGRVAAR